MISVCPVAEIETPLDKVWPLLVDPSQLDLWWDAKVHSARPAGLMAPGQIIEAGAESLFKIPLIRLAVTEVDHAQHRLGLVVSLPFGITDHVTICCLSLGPSRCRVTYG
jgi:hypothetical protein